MCGSRNHIRSGVKNGNVGNFCWGAQRGRAEGPSHPPPPFSHLAPPRMRKNIKFIITRFVLSSKCTKIRFRLGLRWGAYDALPDPHSPPLDTFESQAQHKLLATPVLMSRNKCTARMARIVLLSVVYVCVFVCLSVCQHDNS